MSRKISINIITPAGGGEISIEIGAGVGLFLACTILSELVGGPIAIRARCRGSINGLVV